MNGFAREWHARKGSLHPDRDPDWDQTLAGQVADQLAVTDTVEPTTPQEVLDLLTAQKQQAADPARAAWFAAQRAMLAYLEARPELPVPPPYTSTTLTVFLPHDSFAEVKEIAGRIGVTAEVRDDGNYCAARREFGRGVSYEVGSHTKARMDRHDAEMSYVGRVIP